MKYVSLIFKVSRAEQVLSNSTVFSKGRLILGIHRFLCLMALNMNGYEEDAENYHFSSFNKILLFDVL